MNRTDYDTSAAPKVGQNTPWGVAEVVSMGPVPGMRWVSCANHGGAWACPDLVEEMPERFKQKTSFYPLGSSPDSACWFEEDVEVMRLVLSFHEAFDPAQVRVSLKCWKNMGRI